MSAPKKDLKEYPFLAQWFGIYLVVLPIVTTCVWGSMRLLAPEWYPLGWLETAGSLFAMRHVYKWTVFKL